jgi:hypothetical protein
LQEFLGYLFQKWYVTSDLCKDCQPVKLSAADLMLGNFVQHDWFAAMKFLNNNCVGI